MQYRKIMLSGMFITLALSFLCNAQPMDSELMFHNLSTSTDQASVSVELDGVVFREDGEYATQTTDMTPLSLTGSSTAYTVGNNEWLYWESACPGDGSDAGNKGTVGWGRYKVTIDGPLSGSAQTLVFHINMVDGAWCDPDLDPENTLYFQIETDQSLGTLVVEYYNWYASEWQRVYSGDEIRSWDIRDHDVARERSRLTYDDNSANTFTIPAGSYPLYVSNATLDVNAEVTGDLLINNGNTFKIHYFSEADGTKHADTLVFRSADAGITCLGGSTLDIKGFLSGYETGFESPPPYYPDENVGVILKRGSNSLWRGIKVTSASNGETNSVTIRGAKLEATGIAVNLELYPTNHSNSKINCTIDSSWIDTCSIYGVLNYGATFSSSYTLYDNIADAGIFYLMQDGRISGVDYDILECTIRNVGRDGIRQIWNGNYYEPESSDGLSIKNTWVSNCGEDNIQTLDCITSIHDCKLIQAGRNGVLVNNGIASIHGNQPIEDNNYAGVRITATQWVHGRILPRQSGAHPSGNSVDGLNCFKDNGTNVLVDNETPYGEARHTISKGVFGIRNKLGPIEPGEQSVLSPSIVYGGNNWFIVVDDGKLQAAVNDESYLWVQSNYWNDMPPNNFDDQNGTIFYQPLEASEVVPGMDCDEDKDISPVSEATYVYSDTTQMVLENLNQCDYDSAYYFAQQKVSQGLSSYEALIYAEAFVRAHVILKDSEARAIMENYAFAGVNPGDTSTVKQWVFTHYLMKLDLMSNNFDSALVTADTILQRNYDQNEFDDIEANSAKALIYLTAIPDTLAADSIATYLFNNYRSNYTACFTYFIVTGDTTAFDSVYSKRSNIQEATRFAPTKLTLAQNYPNPFNPNTQITFGVPEDGEVELTVYDVMGREVAALVSGMHQAGEYTYPFHAGTLPSGVYIYKLRFGNTVLAKQMMLTK